MLSPLWCLPLLLAVLAGVGLWRGAQLLAHEAAELQGAVVKVGALRPQVAQFREELAAVDALRRGVDDLGPR